VTGDPDTDPLADAMADLATARAVVAALRRRVAVGLDGAASRGVAEYRLQGALRRLDALGWPTDHRPGRMTGAHSGDRADG
jgi:hypothetical protein